MKEPKLKTVYVCSNCGETSPRWMGRCPSCGSWNTMNEDVVAEAPKAGLSGGKAAAPVRQEGVTSLTARRLADISTTEEKSRILTGISELDRVLGGGIVLGGVVLLSGEPGVGKSTMLLQLCGAISNQHTVLYITGEESVRQVKLRAARLKVPQDNIYLAAENDVDEICGLIEKEKPELVVIDSIQTMRCMLDAVQRNVVLGGGLAHQRFVAHADQLHAVLLDGLCSAFQNSQWGVVAAHHVHNDLHTCFLLSTIAAAFVSPPLGLCGVSISSHWRGNTAG